MNNAKPHRLIYVDLLRGLAALAVLLYHVRATVNLSPGLAGGGLLGKIWMAFSCHGSSAVIVFFVLSGYMVGGGVLRSLRNGTWSWRDYAIARFTRLYVVLIPALLLTLLLDVSGRNLIPSSEIYVVQTQDSDYSLRGPNTFPGSPTTWLSHSVFLGNLLFLQDMICPVLGTNGALWSLSYEFWYYLLFPCMLLVFQERSGRERLAYVFLACAIAWLLGSKGLFLMTAWLAGAGMAWLFANFPARPNPVWLRFLVWVTFACHGLALAVFSAIGPVWSTLLSAGLTCAILWVETRASGDSTSWYTRPVEGLSEMSYTLYATHYPLLFLLHALWLGNQKLHHSPSGIVTALTIAAIAFGFAYAWWWLFERRTNEIRDFFRQRLPGGARESSAAPSSGIISPKLNHPGK